MYTNIRAMNNSPSQAKKLNKPNLVEHTNLLYIFNNNVTTTNKWLIKISNINLFCSLIYMPPQLTHTYVQKHLCCHQIFLTVKCSLPSVA